MIPGFDLYKEQFQVMSSDVIKPGLTAIEQAMDKLTHPELDVPVVHVAGTNGKGSTIAMLESICRTHGLKTLTFTSPCIEDVHDQIKVNNEPLQPFQMNEIFTVLKKAEVSGELTDFELLTAAAFVACRLYKPDIAIIEAGLGGRFDSTNVVQPIVSIIPSIALEHTNFLGDTIEKIAWHKAGILKRGATGVIGPLQEEAMNVITEQAERVGTRLKVDGLDFDVLPGENYVQGMLEITDLHRLLKGQHQMHNMGLAITAFIEVASKIPLTLQVPLVRQGIAKATIPGRFEQISHNVFLDGAHNPASAKMLKETMKQQFQDAPIHIVMGILKDKDIDGVLAELEEVCDDFIFVEVDREQHRLMPAEELMQRSKATHKKVAENALQAVVEKRKEPGFVIMTGSLYLLAQWRHELLEAFKGQ
ncbi:bifunctional folylpolyglutamate synthase/dihydrofolate synthase [Kurthia senegalensis]|uniref:bifunctional folylpolyglutamate synthase/dihydrofolate synthase n=1 Tax=Kurthia senegalensis TaxID=1033740 RepID=UPI000287A529|nr:folylpolyglutamate synthase/dihydrofolate synthase family protein [Kurthia senegalensis]